MRNAGRYGWITLALACTFALVAAAAEPMSEADTVKAAQAVKEAQAYPLDYCIVTAEKLGSMGDPVVKVYDGREVRFCCKGCVKTFEKDQTKWTKKLDDAIVAAQKATYPLETCVVSGEVLGGMGEPVDFVYQNRLVRFCCKGCVKTFQKDPEKYLRMLDAAATSQTPKDEKPVKMDGHSHEGVGH